MEIYPLKDSLHPPLHSINEALSRFSRTHMPPFDKQLPSINIELNS